MWLTCRYFKEKHWLANNVLGLAFSVQGIEHLSLGAVSTGVILLSGLFFYDIFWVFCTPVMVAVVSIAALLYALKCHAITSAQSWCYNSNRPQLLTQKSANPDKVQKLFACFPLFALLS
jgi:hypothetical protein